MKSKTTKESDLVKLEELTKALPEFIKSEGPGYNELELLEGVGFIFALYNIDEVAVVRGVLSKGSIIPKTKIEQRTWMIVFKGSIKMIQYEGCESDTISKTEVINKGEQSIWEKDSYYGAESLTDSETITISIPTTTKFPKEIK